MLVRDLTIKALIPWVEKQLKLLHEVVTNRKSRWEEKMNMILVGKIQYYSDLFSKTFKFLRGIVAQW